MSENEKTTRPPLRIRLLHALAKEPDWATMTAGQLAALAAAENRKRASRLARVITGRPDRDAAIEWQQVTLPDRRVPVRVYRPSASRADLPLVLHIHGGGFAGTAVQSDWVNSYLAARLPAVVVSVEHRLLAPGTPLTAAVADGWDALAAVVGQAQSWGIDPGRAAVFGESTGGVIAALAALRARDSGLALRAQVLVNACVDVSQKMFDHASMVEFADSPTLTMPQMELFARLAVPPGTDPLPLSPLQAHDLSRLPPALVLVPTFDPLSDQGRRYAERLRDAGTPVTLTEFPGATHAFLSMPGAVPQAQPARAEILEFLRERFGQPGEAS